MTPLMQERSADTAFTLSETPIALSSLEATRQLFDHHGSDSDLMQQVLTALQAIESLDPKVAANHL